MAVVFTGAEKGQALLDKMNAFSSLAGDVQQAKTDAEEAVDNAQQEVQLCKDEVQLCKNEVTLAQGYKDDAQAIAESGLPSQTNKAGMSLVSDGESTEWLEISPPIQSALDELEELSIAMAIAL